MAKLIYVNKTKAQAIAANGIFGSTASSWTSSDNSYFNSLVFTNDGHLITHGIDFSISPSSGLMGGAAGSIPYQSAADTTAFLAAPSGTISNASNGNYVLSYNTTDSAPVWKKIINYKLSLNGSTNGDTNGTSLGTLYAPTTAGSQYLIVMSNGSGAPSWKTLTAISSGDTYEIPTLSKVNELITTTVTSLFEWKGDTSSMPTTAATKVGYAWRASSSFTIAATHAISGSAETLEVGDILICTTPYSSSDTTNAPKFTVVNTNWTTASGTSALAWNSEKTLATIGGLAIKAKLPVDPLTRISYTTSVASDALGVYTLGNFTKDSANTTIYGIDTRYTFYVGASGAKANAAVSNGTDVYLTTKPNTAASTAAGTNVLGLKAGTAISISANNSKLITITNTGLRAATASVASNVTGVYTIGTITKGDGNTLTLYGHDVNTWREVKVYKIADSAQDGTIDQLLSTSISTNPLKFSNTFSVNSNDEVDLVWEEIDSSGNKTYHV